MEDSAARDPEFQAVIIVDYDDGRLFPLTETVPRCLLPVANRPLISYQLDMLSKSNIAETFIVVPHDYEQYFAKFLREYVRRGMTIDLVVVEDMMGTADGLRAVADRIRGDFFLMSADFINEFSLAELTTKHRLQAADITITLVPFAKDAPRDDIDQEFVGLSHDDRVLIKTPALEVDGSITVQKALLRAAGSKLKLRMDLSDLGICLVSLWLLEFIVVNRRFSSVRNDVLPYIINRQYQSEEYLFEHIPTLQHRRRPLSDVEKWVTGGASRAGGTVLETRNQESGGDLLRVFAHVLDAPKEGVVCTRLTTLASYVAINKDIPMMNFTPRTPWGRCENYLKKEATVLGENSTITEQAVTVKQCCIGNNVKIGARSKLNNCIVMENAVIGENCTIQNSIICDRAVVENNCNLNECNVGSGFRVVTGTKIRGESFSTISQAQVM